MPSPIAHSAVALTARALIVRHDTLRRAVAARPRFFYGAVVATLLAPDVDFLLGEVFHDPALWHGGATHSLVGGVLFGLMFLLACRIWYGATFPKVAGLLVGTACAWSHALMDMATWGRGVRILWPFSLERHTTVTLFFGAHHSQPLAWKLHLITLVTESLFVIVLWWFTRRVLLRASRSASSERLQTPEGATCGE
jgi:LexA-binding, inner membrane-associated putative hydrolase